MKELAEDWTSCESQNRKVKGRWKPALHPLMPMNRALWKVKGVFLNMIILVYQRKAMSATTTEW